MNQTRKETDSLGPVEIPANALWGAQTERSLHNFDVGEKLLPLTLIHALVTIKKYAASVNAALGVLPKEKSLLINTACDEILTGNLDDQFPLKIFQTGSGTQSNMNVNEVIANYADQLAGSPLGSKTPIHPNDDVNCSQSSNDVFPTAMHIAIAHTATTKLIPALKSLIVAFGEKEAQFHHIIKIGRTHLMDAVPLRLGDEFSGYRFQLDEALRSIQHGISLLMPLPIGATAVGTGLNCPEGFSLEMVRLLGNHYDLPFRVGSNFFALLSSHDDCVEFSSNLKRLASALFKIGSDIRLMGSGPRSGFSELILPENEPGSSIMPGKINPTQCEMITQVSCQIMGLDAAISFAGSQGHFELNVFKPLIASNILEMITLLASAMESFRIHCIIDLKANEKQIQHHVERSLLLATALVPRLGYDTVSKVVIKAHTQGISLKEALLQLKLLTTEEIDDLLRPEKFVT